MTRFMTKRMLKMIDLYYTPSPNGHKITLFLEEAQLQYRLIHVDISKGSQFHPDFLQIRRTIKSRPLSIMPRWTAEGPSACLSPEKFYSIWRKRAVSCSAVNYANATPRCSGCSGRSAVWVLCWGRIIISVITLRKRSLTPLKIRVETQRLYNVMNKRLESSPRLGGDHYSIADIASWPWIHAHQRQRIDLDNYPAVNNWHERIRTRPATERAMQHAQSEKR